MVQNVEVLEVKIGAVKPNPVNPRTIKESNFKKLVKSIKDFPEMLSIREIAVDENMVILGGNMRYKACVEAGLKKIQIVKITGLTKEQKDEFIIKDNVNYGKWDWDILANSFDDGLLREWGMNIWTPEDYTLEASEELDSDSDTDFGSGSGDTMKVQKKVIQIEFVITDYSHANELVNYLKARKVDIGALLIESMKKALENAN